MQFVFQLLAFGDVGDGADGADRWPSASMSTWPRLASQRTSPLAGAGCGIRIHTVPVAMAALKAVTTPSRSWGWMEASHSSRLKGHVATFQADELKEERGSLDDPRSPGRVQRRPNPPADWANSKKSAERRSGECGGASANEAPRCGRKQFGWRALEHVLRGGRRNLLRHILCESTNDRMRFPNPVCCAPQAQGIGGRVRA